MVEKVQIEGGEKSKGATFWPYQKSLCNNLEKDGDQYMMNNTCVVMHDQRSRSGLWFHIGKERNPSLNLIGLE